MSSFERFGIGFISALLYPALKCTQSEVPLGSVAAFLGVLLPFALIGILVGLYAFLVEKSETDRGKLFRICMALPAFVLGLASTPVSTEARADSFEVSCEPISDFQKGWYDVISAITNTKRIRYFLVSMSDVRDDYVSLNKKRYYILARLDSKPEGGLVFDVDRCQLMP